MIFENMAEVNSLIPPPDRPARTALTSEQNIVLSLCGSQAPLGNQLRTIFYIDNQNYVRHNIWGILWKLVRY